MMDTIFKFIHKDYISSGLAATAVASPVWLPIFDVISKGASEILPILGVILILVQIYAYLRYNPKKDDII